jgi:hypothetical protein
VRTAARLVGRVEAFLDFWEMSEKESRKNVVKGTWLPFDEADIAGENDLLDGKHFVFSAFENVFFTFLHTNKANNPTSKAIPKRGNSRVAMQRN